MTCFFFMGKPLAGREDILFDYSRLFEEKKEEGTDRVIVHYIDEV